MALQLTGIRKIKLISRKFQMKWKFNENRLNYQAMSLIKKYVRNKLSPLVYQKSNKKGK